MGTTLEETLRYALDYSDYFGENILSYMCLGHNINSAFFY